MRVELALILLVTILHVIGSTTAAPAEAAAKIDTGVHSDDGDDDGPQTELGKKLQEHLNQILGKIEDAIDHGKVVKEEYITKMKEIQDKLRELGEHIGKRTKEFLEKLKEKAKDYWKKILERLGLD